MKSKTGFVPRIRREVAAVLEQQQTAVEQQTDSSAQPPGCFESLRSEVLRIDEVDFKKYAEIIELLRMGNKITGSGNASTKRLPTIYRNAMQRPELGERLVDTYRGLLDEALRLIQQNEPPDSEASMAFGKKWWDLIMNLRAAT